MNTTKPPPGVPDASRTSMTPHSHDQLVMSTTEDPFTPIRLYDQGREEWRPALVTHPEKGSYAVVHTPEDYPRALKCMDKTRFEAYVEPKIEEWEPSIDQKNYIRKAREGGFDEDAERFGFDDSYSYVLHLFETEKRFRDTWTDTVEA